MVVVFPVPFTPTTNSTRGEGPRSGGHRGLPPVAGAARIFTIWRFSSCCSAPASSILCSFTCSRSEASTSLVVRTPMSALEQRGFELLQQLRVDGPVAGQQLLDARGEFRARFGDRLLQPVEKRGLGFSKQ